MWKARVGLSDIVFPVISLTGTSALLGLTRRRTLPQDVKYSAVNMFRFWVTNLKCLSFEWEAWLDPSMIKLSSILSTQTKCNAHNTEDYDKRLGTSDIIASAVSWVEWVRGMALVKRNVVFLALWWHRLTIKKRFHSLTNSAAEKSTASRQDPPGLFPLSKGSSGRIVEETLYLRIKRQGLALLRIPSPVTQGPPTGLYLLKFPLPPQWRWSL